VTTSRIYPFIRQLRLAALVRDEANLTDEHLLTCFIEQRDEAAFEVLVRRYGPMILGVCRRILRDQHDADDAFQATFLVLVRKATSIVPRTMLGNWLHGVAQTTALRAKVAGAKRAVRERRLTRMSEPAAAECDDVGSDLRPLIDQELRCLPEKYRRPLILCHLESRSIKEAARQLGWPQGTLAGRLARARIMMAKRLARHGLFLAGGALAAVLSENSAPACVSTMLVSATVRAASMLATGRLAPGAVSSEIAILTEGVVKSMMITRLKIASAMLLSAAILVSGGAIVYHSQTVLAASPPEDPKASIEPVQKSPSNLTDESNKEVRAVVYPVAGLVISPVDGRNTVNALAKAIQAQIAPETWDSKGGKGRLDYYPLGQALVVNQTPDNHEKIRQFLSKLENRSEVVRKQTQQIVELFNKMQDLDALLGDSEADVKALDEIENAVKAMKDKAKKHASRGPSAGLRQLRNRGEQVGIGAWPNHECSFPPTHSR
jgi:RNA polymerase sigma factor (sigma-70 family)